MKQLNNLGMVQVLPGLRIPRVQRFSRSGRVFAPTFIGATFDNGFEIHFDAEYKYFFIYPNDQAGQQALSHFAQATPMTGTGLWGGEWFNGYVRSQILPLKNLQ